MEAYCVKCKQKREMVEAVPTFTSTGTPATRGICPVCGTSLYRMGRTEAHEGLTPPEVQPRPKKKKAAKRSGNLVIVESPAKARTVGRLLGGDFRVKASVGHVRDLLRSQLSVDVEHDFTPKYRVPNEKREVVKELKSDSAKAAAVYLATDPDREGEAIAWHLLEAAEIDPDVVHRVVFHEITQEAVQEAFHDPRTIDMNLVDSQQARRVLDRLVGYNLSPLLWKKVRGRLSAGRVQSVALRLIVEREREISSFESQEYWTIDGEFVHPEKPPSFLAKLVGIDGQEPALSSQEGVEPVLADLRTAEFWVNTVKPGTRKRNPSAPFTTSTLQQTASRRLGYTARRTMALAQQLYEGIELGGGDQIGLITYMRTDSTQVSDQAKREARAFIQSEYGAGQLPAKSPTYETRTRGAQEAHEAIRPTSVRRTPQSLKDVLKPQQHKLYDLIWRRFVASQMEAAVYDTMTIEIDGRSISHQYQFRISVSSLRFPGFLSVYKDDERDRNSHSTDFDSEKVTLESLPNLSQGDQLKLIDLIPEQHFTQPPPRYSDASLIRALEENGVGRPSTYAPIITTLRQRGYIIREKRRLIPTEIGVTVNDLLVAHFPEVIDFGFTARMEAELDDIAAGDREWVDVVRDFYEPFSRELETAFEAMPEVRAEPEELDRSCPECGHPLVIRHGRFGKFIGCSNFPKCRFTEPILEKIGVACPLDGGDLVQRYTRKGRIFYGCSNYPDCEFTSWKRPVSVPCPNCEGLLVEENHTKLSCIRCKSSYPKNELISEEPDLA